MKAEKEQPAIVVQQHKDETDAQSLARVVLSPSLLSALTIREYGKGFEGLELMSLVDELRSQIDQTIDGNLDRAEAMLTAQSHSLDAIFSNLARLAINAEYLSNFDTYLKLGLRAQSQCRATWESLAAIKNPVGRAYVGQANFAHNQQVNNGTEPSRARENENSPNKLVEEKPCEKWLDGGASKDAVQIDVGVDSHMATVGEQHRAKNT